MENIVYRLATMDEIDVVSIQIAESYKTAYRNMMSDAYLDSLTGEHWVPILREGFDKGDTCIIAEADGRVVGAAIYGGSDREASSADLHAIYLSPQFVGIGVGHRLYSEVEASMRAQRYKCSILEVLVDNHRAVRFYLDHGYAIADTFVVQENGMELTCHIMKKELQ